MKECKVCKTGTCLACYWRKNGDKRLNMSRKRTRDVEAFKAMQKQITASLAEQVAKHSEQLRRKW